MSPYVFIPIAAIIVSAAFVAVSFAWNTERRATRSMASLFGCTFVWGVLELLAALESEPVRALVWLRWIHVPGLMLAPSVLWILTEMLPQTRSPETARRTRAAAIGSLAVAVGLGFVPGMTNEVVSNGLGGWTPRFGTTAFVLIPLSLIVPLYIASLASRSSVRRSDRRSDRRRAWGVRFGLLMGASVVFPSEFGVPLFDLPLPRLGCLGVATAAGFVWLAVLHDVDELGETPQSVARSLLARLQDGVALVQMDGTILSHNPRFAELAGYAGEDDDGEGKPGLLGRPIASVVGAPLERIREGVEDREAMLHRRDGEAIPISLSSSIAWNRVGDGVGFVIAVRDLREIDALRSQLLGSGRRAAIGELAAGIAHEVNNPVAFMRSDFNVLRERIVEVRERLLETTRGLDGMAPLDRSTARVDRALAGLARVSEVVVDVREFAHVGGTGQGGADPLAVVEGAMRLARLERGDDVTLRTARAHATTPIGCGQELKQALLALLRMLADATQKGGHVEATLRGSDRTLEIELLASPLRVDVEEIVDRISRLGPAEPEPTDGIALTAAVELIAQLRGRLRAAESAQDAVRVEIEVPIEGAVTRDEAPRAGEVAS